MKEQLLSKEKNEQQKQSENVGKLAAFETKNTLVNASTPQGTLLFVNKWV